MIREKKKYDTKTCMLRADTKRRDATTYTFCTEKTVSRYDLQVKGTEETA